MPELNVRIYCNDLHDEVFEHVYRIEVTPCYWGQGERISEEAFRSIKAIHPRDGSVFDDTHLYIFPPEEESGKCFIWFYHSSFLIERIHYRGGVVLKDPIEVARHFWPDYDMPVQRELSRRLGRERG